MRASKKIDDDVVLPNCDVIVFQIYGQFGATGKPDSRRMVCNTYIFINNKTELKSLAKLPYYWFE